MSQRKDHRTENLQSEFVRRTDQLYSWPRSLMPLVFQDLRGFWPLSTNNGTLTYDLSGQARNLTINNAPTFSMYNLVPYVDFNGTTQSLSRADETGLDITGNLTMGCWVWFDTTGGVEYIFSKWLPTGNQRSYALYKNASENIVFDVSNVGTSTTFVTSTGAVTSGAWYHIAGRYTPSTELAVWVNNLQTTNTTSIPASIFNSTAALYIAARDTNAQNMNGRVAFPFLCASALGDEIIFAHYEATRFLFE